jgi:hypothetical protein
MKISELPQETINQYSNSLSSLADETRITKTDLNTPKHYDNSKGSIYKFCDDQKLNSWESDIIKRIVRCRKKGEWESDLEKTKNLINLYLKEYENTK